MFDMGFTEMMLIGIVALVVIGLGASQAFYAASLSARA